VSTLRIRFVLIAAAATAAAQLILGGVLALWSVHRAQTDARVQLDAAERIITVTLAQRREQLISEALVASHDPALVQAVSEGSAEAISQALSLNLRRAGVQRAFFERPDGSLLAQSPSTSNAPAGFSAANEAAIRTAIVFGRGSGLFARGSDIQMWSVGALDPEAGGIVFVESVKRRLLQELGVLPAVSLSLGAGGQITSPAEANSAWQRHLLLTEVGADAVAVDLSLAPVTVGGVIADSAAAWIVTWLCTLAAAVAGIYLVTGQWLAPMARLQGALKRTAAGDYQPVRDIPPVREVGDLALAFNSMVEGLQQRERRFLQTAYRDTLTSLPNRTLFQERLVEAVQHARKLERQVSVLLLDINQFKSVNESLGHATGDVLLIELAERIRRVLRSADNAPRPDNERRKRDPREDKSAGPTLARLAGDDFAVLLPGCTAAQAERVAARLIDAARRPFVHEGQTVLLSATIGAAEFPEHALDADGLLQAADNALYEAKSQHRTVLCFDVEHERKREQRASLLGDLRRALDHDELSLVFQPKVSLAGSPRLMVEALLRWVHPERGPQSPADFVPFAEMTGFITSITRWALDHALAQSATWLRSGLDVQVGVNVSARDLAGEDFTTYVVDRLRHHGLKPDMLTIEVNEAALVKEPLAARRCLEVLDRLGVKLAIDDFGTGFSSLQYLRELPVDAVKIDRSFVSEILSDPGARIVVKSTIDLAHSLSMRAIAEGVETPEILQMLRELGCDYAQGYYFGRPLSASDYAAWVEHQARRFEPAAQAQALSDPGAPGRLPPDLIPADAAQALQASAYDPLPDASQDLPQAGERADQPRSEEAPEEDAPGQAPSLRGDPGAAVFDLVLEPLDAWGDDVVSKSSVHSAPPSQADQTHLAADPGPAMELLADVGHGAAGGQPADSAALGAGPILVEPAEGGPLQGSGRFTLALEPR
jgi:predicted signal transduction protein with EAL and GGDEF domain